MRYLIDGYNLLYYLDSSFGELESSRKKLIDSLCNSVDELNLNCILIFDAGQTPDFARHHLNNLEIVYTSTGETADEYILFFLEHERSRKSNTVVTSDGRLAWKARRLGAKTQKVGAFLKSLKNRSAKRSASLSPHNTNYDPFINHYLEIFQKRFEELDE